MLITEVVFFLAEVAEGGFLERNKPASIAPIFKQYTFFDTRFLIST